MASKSPKNCSTVSDSRSASARLAKSGGTDAVSRADRCSVRTPPNAAPGIGTTIVAVVSASTSPGSAFGFAGLTRCSICEASTTPRSRRRRAAWSTGPAEFSGSLIRSSALACSAGTTRSGPSFGAHCGSAPGAAAGGAAAAGVAAGVATPPLNAFGPACEKAPGDGAPGAGTAGAGLPP